MGKWLWRTDHCLLQCQLNENRSRTLLSTVTGCVFLKREVTLLAGMWGVWSSCVLLEGVVNIHCENLCTFRMKIRITGSLVVLSLLLCAQEKETYSNRSTRSPSLVPNNTEQK